LSASRDNNYIASGGADRTVSVWTYELSQKYTYTHLESIQCVAFNPVLHAVLASCSSVDFAIWTMPSSTLRKIRVGSKILCASWTTDGQTLALGMQNGLISLRDVSGAERSVIERPAPVWDLVWAPMAAKDKAAMLTANGETIDGDVLTVASWDGNLSFYSQAGQQVGKERALGFDPTSVRCELTDGNTAQYSRIFVHVDMSLLNAYALHVPCKRLLYVYPNRHELRALQCSTRAITWSSADQTRRLCCILAKVSS
jgi:WD40 repeat protein